MAHLWTCLDLKCPADDLVEYKTEDSYHIESLNEFVTELMTCATTLTCDHPIWNELSVLQNIQSKYKRILRCDRCLYYLHRIAHCLQKIVLLDLSKSYLDLADRFLKGFKNFQLPSRQQVQFVLVRTQTTAKLVCEAINYTQETFCFLVQKLKIGHLLLDLVMAASVTARLHVMLKGLVVQLCDMYKKALSWSGKVKVGEFKWGEHFHLPFDLEQWLSVTEPGLNKAPPIAKEDVQFLKKYLENRNGNNESDTDSVVEIDQEDVDCMIVDEKNYTDYGEIVQRKKGVKKKTSFSPMQKRVLKQILTAPNFEKLEDVWNGINKLEPNSLPHCLSIKKKRAISKILARKKEICSKSHNKSKKKHVTDVHIIARQLAKHLAFTEDQINLIQGESDDCIILPQNGINLIPVNSLKELRILYRRLCKNLLSVQDLENHRRLKSYFRRQKADIKLLQQTSQKKAAKNLVLCTSKIMLTLFHNTPSSE